MKKHSMVLCILAKTKGLLVTAFFLLSSGLLLGQTQTYHLHSEAAVDGAAQHQLLVGAADDPVATYQGGSMSSPGDYFITDFETIAGVPNASGYIPASSQFTFSLWMRKTASLGLAYPKAAIYLNSQNGTLLCASNGATALTTTLTQILSFSCRTRVAVSMSASDRFYLWVGASEFAAGDTTLKGELDIEGTPGGNYDSTVTVTLPTAGPNITSIRNAQTNEAKAAIGGTVTISGSGFGSSQGNSLLSFNGVPAAVCTSSSCWAPDGTSITATVPAGVTTGNVVVSVNGINSNGVNLTIVPAPAITNVLPTTGASNWIPQGGSITISGSNFGSTAGTVVINGTTASTTAWTNTSITLTPTNLSVGVGNTAVVNASGIASQTLQFAVHAAPSWHLGGDADSICLALYMPANCVHQGAIGALVDLSGADFGQIKGDSIATFAGVQATDLTQFGSNTLQARIPTGITPGGVNVVVAVDGVSTAPFSFTVLAPPTINANGVSPSACSSGANCEGTLQVMITGNNFGTTAGTVSFNGTLAPIVSWGAGQITATVPVGAGNGTAPVPVVVNANGASSNAVTFTVLPNINPPLVPSSGPVGTSVLISGTGFGSAQGTVTFNGTPATPTSWSDTRIAVPVPSGVSPGSVTVTVTAGGTPVNASFTVTASPSITGLSPTSGATGIPVAITGSAFGTLQGSGVVRFNNYPAQVCTSCTVCSGSGGWQDTCIAATVPNAATTGAVSVSVNSGQTAIGPTFTVTGLGTQQITGTVSCTPNPTVTVQALVQGVVKGSTTTSCNASYAIPSLAAGSYDVQASAPVYGTATQNAVPVVLGQDTSNINFSLGTAGTITGQITKASGGAPINQATVSVYVGSAQVASVNTGATNTYTIGNLNAGIYRVQASAADPVTGPYVTQTQVVTLTAGGTATQNFALQSPGAPGNSIVYSYDNLGRLVTVRDQGGDTAVYNYDAVGNITSIDRRSGSQVTILSLDHPTAAIGSTLTITGTAFSTNPSQDTVIFTGASVAASTATSTQLTVTVPSGAVTGPLSVNVNGTLSNSLPFTVLAGSAPPTITTVGPPTIGISGTTFPVAGTHFDTDSTKDLWRLNITPLAVTANGDPTTNINTTVPTNGMSGHVSITTPAGTAVSTQDFFVPIPGYGVNNIDYPANTGRVSQSPGQLQGTGSVTNLPVGKWAMLLFDAVAGQKATIRIETGNTMTSSCQLIAWAPNSAQLGNVTCSFVGYLSQSFSLPLTGTYTVSIQGSPNPGSLSFSLLDATDVSSPITIGGPVVPVPLNTVGQVGRLTFFGTAGQHVSAPFTHPDPGPSWGAGCLLTLLGPGNQSLTDVPTPYHFKHVQDCSNVSSTFWDIGYLPSTGVYTIVIAPASTSTGTVTIRLLDSTDSRPTAVTPTIPGTTVDINPGITTPGQNIQQVFAGTAGQKLSLKVLCLGHNTTDCQSEVGNLLGRTDFWILGPQNQVVVHVQAGFIQSVPYFIDPRLVAGQMVLPVTGNYTIFIDPNDDSTGSVKFTLYLAPDITASTIDATALLFGASASATAPDAAQQAPGETITFPFLARIGQNLTLRVTESNNAGCTFGIYDPNHQPLPNYLGLSLQYVGCSSSPVLRSLFGPLPASGTYTVVLQPNSYNFGSFTAQLTNTQDNVYTIAPTSTGSELTVSTTVAGQNDVITFAGLGGQTIRLHFTAVNYTSGGGGLLTITDPNGTQIRFAEFGTNYNIDTTLTQGVNGVYTILISPGYGQYTTTGSATFTMSILP